MKSKGFGKGGAFAMGAIGGTIWHGIKGARNSPRGDRFIGSMAAIKARAPVVGGNVSLVRLRKILIEAPAVWSLGRHVFYI